MARGRPARPTARSASRMVRLLLLRQRPAVHVKFQLLTALRARCPAFQRISEVRTMQLCQRAIALAQRPVSNRLACLRERGVDREQSLIERMQPAALLPQ